MNYEVVHDPELAFNEQLRMEVLWETGRELHSFNALIR